jgi:hypothetical protein
MIAVEGPFVLRRYYAILTGGASSYGDGTALLPLLTEDFVFEGPIAGRMEGAVRFAHGARGFIETVNGIAISQAVTTPYQAAVLYDAELPGGTVRFAEFFRLDGDRIRELIIHYNADQYVAKGGR